MTAARDLEKRLAAARKALARAQAAEARAGGFVEHPGNAGRRTLLARERELEYCQNETALADLAVRAIETNVVRAQERATQQHKEI
jgi:hypothetical protein